MLAAGDLRLEGQYERGHAEVTREVDGAHAPRGG
jgi:hypothetical protein